MTDMNFERKDSRHWAYSSAAKTKFSKASQRWSLLMLGRTSFGSIFSRFDRFKVRYSSANWFLKVQNGRFKVGYFKVRLKRLISLISSKKSK